MQRLGAGTAEIADSDCFDTLANSSEVQLFSLAVRSPVVKEQACRLVQTLGLGHKGRVQGKETCAPTEMLWGSLPCPSPWSEEQLWLSRCYPGMFHTCCSWEPVDHGPSREAAGLTLPRA